MSSNFFAALDDSGDEAPAAPVAKESKASSSNNIKKASLSKPVEPSKPDDRQRPNSHDRNTKFGRGGRAPARDGKRAYDRRSGTGRGREIKKDGGGAHNWGSDKNDARQAQGLLEEGGAEAPAEEIVKPEGVEDEAVAKDENAGETEADKEYDAEPEPEPEPEDNTMTYEEYLALKQQKAAESSVFQPVKERTIENNEFAKVAPKKKAEDEAFLVMGGAKQKRDRKKAPGAAQTDDAAKELLSFRVESGASEGRGRGRGGRGRGGRGGEFRGGRGFDREGGRGRGRGDYGGRGRGDYGGRGRGDYGGRGRGSGRGGGRGRGGDGGLNVMDEEAFPSL